LRIVGVSYGRRFGSKIAKGNWKEGDGWVRLQSRYERVTTHMEAAASMWVVTLSLPAL
jgi:hypothetical protein